MHLVALSYQNFPATDSRKHKLEVNSTGEAFGGLAGIP